MPYAHDHIGIYKIVNTATGGCYVGQSQRVKKRVAEHFRLLRLNKHSNDHLQNAFNKYGEDKFVWVMEVECEDLTDIDALEEGFIQGGIAFQEPCVYNIADFAKAPMRGKAHTDETRRKIRESLAKNPEHLAKIKSKEHHEKCEAGRLASRLSNPEWVAKLKFILDNDHMSYAARGRHVGKDTGSVRKLYLRYIHLKGVI